MCGEENVGKGKRTQNCSSRSLNGNGRNRVTNGGVGSSSSRWECHLPVVVGVSHLPGGENGGRHCKREGRYV